MDDLKILDETFKKEKNSKMIRMLAVRPVRTYGMQQNEVATILDMSNKTVSKWIKRFDDGGVDALSDLPRSGAPPKVEQEILKDIIKKEEKEFRTIPVCAQLNICEQTDVWYHISHVRKLMHHFNLSPKRPRLYHTKKATRRIIKR